MDSESDELESPPKPGILRRALRLIQWVAAVFLSLMGLILVLATLRELGAPGAPVSLFWVSVAALTIALLALFPPIFFRLPKRGGAAAYLAFVFALIFFGYEGESVSSAWEKTPQGAKEAEIRKNEEVAAAVAEDEQKAADAAEQLRQSRAKAIADVNESLNGCVSTWSGGIPALTDDVKNSLENPHAFEHVETKILGPTPDGYNVEMTFRGQNAFGAIRTGWVRAEIDPSNCALKSRGPLVDDE